MDYRSKIFISSGLYSLVGLVLAFFLVSDYSDFEMGVNQLPIDIFQWLLFGLAVVVVITSLLSAYFTARKSASRITIKKRFNLLIPVFIGMIVVLLLLDRNQIDLVVPVSLVFYGLILLNLNRYVSSRLIYLATSLILLGILAWLIKGWNWYAMLLGFSVFPIIFGLVLRKSKSPSSPDVSS